ncbi:MAG: PilZ domain-containing protein [Planctomycetota bacterium]
MTSRTERRRHPRVSISLPLRLTMGDSTVESLIQDLSSSGIRFRIPKPLPLLSRVQIALELPEPELAGASSSLALTGVVVRCDRIVPGDSLPYDAAIYFDEISRRARGQLDQFLSRQSS